MYYKRVALNKLDILKLTFTRNLELGCFDHSKGYPNQHRSKFDKPKKQMFPLFRNLSRKFDLYKVLKIARS